MKESRGDKEMGNLSIGVQSKEIVFDENPLEGFGMMRRAGFSCCDFSLNSYLANTSLYALELNDFFDRPIEELKSFFHYIKKRRGLQESGSTRCICRIRAICQMRQRK